MNTSKGNVRVPSNIYVQWPTYRKGIRLAHGSCSDRLSRRKRQLYSPFCSQQGLFSCWEFNKTKFHCNSLRKSTNKPEKRSGWETQGRGGRASLEMEKRKHDSRAIMAPLSSCFDLLSFPFLFIFFGYFSFPSPPPLPPPGAKLLGKEESQAQRCRFLLLGYELWGRMLPVSRRTCLSWKELALT